MTDLEFGEITVSTSASGAEVTSKITALERAQYQLRFDVETPDGTRVRPTDAEVAARFYLSNQLMYFTVGVPAGLQGTNTLHVFVDGKLESSKAFTVPAALAPISLG